jgi:pimeloyl-ACP methyl ester carboxylesterase
MGAVAVVTITGEGCHNLRSPTLAPSPPARADGDRFVAPSYARIFGERIPNARVTTIERAGHLIGFEQPAPYADAVVRFGREGR